MLKSLNCKGRLISLERPIIMGILNVNSDSFYEGSRALEIDKILAKVSAMVVDGATIIDVGAMSSRPGAEIISEEVELERILPALEAIHSTFPDVVISVDTVRSEVARKTVEQGASMINDISAGDFDPMMMPLVASMQVPYIMMHMQGLPPTMQNDPKYTDVVLEIMSYFSKKIHTAYKLGITDLVLDPGFGFGKTLDQNYEIMKQLKSFAIFDLPILTGVSRKSMIYKLLNIKVEDALNGSTALHMAALMAGSKILRVHDVSEGVECIKIFEKLS